MLTAADIDIGARTVWGEARGEPYEGKLAVAHVILNRWRARHRGETTVFGVCSEPKQFSCWNESDPNRPKMIAIGAAEPSYRECLRAFLEAIDGPDPTGGALHYHTIGVRPRWSRGKRPSAVIGAHKFFVGIA